VQRKALGKTLQEVHSTGRGLAALLPTTMSEREGVSDIQIDKIIPNRYQPRQQIHPEQLAKLADSLKEHGLIQPISVRKGDKEGTFELIAGERRWRAAKLAGFSTIPAIVKRLDNRKLMEWALIENIQREDLNPIEKAQAYQKLLSQFSLTQEEVAAQVGIDRSSVANFLRLLQLPKEIWEDIATGKISMGHAKLILSVEKEAEQRVVAQEVKRNGWAVRQLEQYLKKLKELSLKKQSVVVSNIVSNVVSNVAPEITDLENRLRRYLGTQVHLKHHGERGEIRIEYYSLSDLDRILEKWGIASS